MQAAVEHSVYGVILYEENIWIGTKKLFVNGQALEKQSKNTFVLVKDKQPVYFTIKGSYLSGIKLIVDDRTFQIVSGPKWYEVLIVVAMVFLYFLWANIPTLCMYLPVIGGAVGAAVCGGVSEFSLYLMRLQKNAGMKVLIGLSMGILTIAINYALAAILTAVL